MQGCLLIVWSNKADFNFYRARHGGCDFSGMVITVH